MFGAQLPPPERMRLQKAIDEESEQLYSEAESLARKASEAFENKRQLRMLEDLAYKARRLSDIYDFIMSQTGRRKAWRENRFGDELLKTVKDLQSRSEGVYTNVFQQSPPSGSPEVVELLRQIHLELTREFVRHLVAHYLYTAQLEEGE